MVQVSLAGGPFTLPSRSAVQGGVHERRVRSNGQLRLVTRNLGDLADEVQTFATDRVWNGPAFYPAVVDGKGAVGEAAEATLAP